MSHVKITVSGIVYREATDLRDRFGCANSTLHEWANAGAVEKIYRGSRCYFREEDVAVLTEFSPEQTRAMGLRRISPERVAQNRAWLDRMQTRTLAVATDHHEEWDLVSDLLVLQTEDVQLVDLALRLGRTYKAVSDRRTILSTREMEEL